MNNPTMAAECLEHLEFLKGFFITPPRKSRFAALYRKILVFYSNPPFSQDASAFEVGCGTDKVLNGLHAPSEMGFHVSPGQIAPGKERFRHLSICIRTPEKLSHSLRAPV
jgi:hypothetical protein